MNIVLIFYIRRVLDYSVKMDKHYDTAKEGWDRAMTEWLKTIHALENATKYYQQLESIYIIKTYKKADYDIH